MSGLDQVARREQTTLPVVETEAEQARRLQIPPDNDDRHALEFYRRLGGVAAPVTIFTFPGDDE